MKGFGGYRTYGFAFSKKIKYGGDDVFQGKSLLRTTNLILFVEEGTIFSGKGCTNVPLISAYIFIYNNGQNSPVKIT